MKLIDKRIVLPSTGSKPENTVNLVAFGDIHIDEPGFQKRVLDRVIHELDTLPNAIGVCIGDVFGFTNTRTRKSVAAGFGQAPGGDEAKDTLDEFMRHRVTDLHKIFAPVKDKLICFVLGNHTWQYANGEYADEQLAHSLGTEFCDGVLAFRLTLATKKKDSPNQKSCYVNIVCHHGTGGSQTEGGDLNNLAKKSSAWDADIYLAGHSHHLYVHTGRARMVFGKARKDFRIHERATHLARTGSMVRAYAGRTTGYIERLGNSPSNLGYVVFKIYIDRLREDNMDIKVPAIEGRAVIVK